MTPVQVFERVFPAHALAVLHNATSKRALASAILDRNSSARTGLEQAVFAVLHELGDMGRFVEVWSRNTWLDVGVHRDLDEAHAHRHCGRQRCGHWAHILYLGATPRIRAPTCVLTEGREPESGVPKALSGMHVVPTVAGRLLRFRAELLHAVPAPTLLWLGNAAKERGAPRVVLLFNTWSKPPLGQRLSPDSSGLPSAHMRPQPRATWRRLHFREALAPSPDAGERLMRLRMPLLGNACRRDCDKLALSADTSQPRVEAALLSASQPWFVPFAPSTSKHRAALDEHATACLPIDTAEGGRGVALVRVSWLGAIFPEAVVQRFNFGYFYLTSLVGTLDGLRTLLASRDRQRVRARDRQRRQKVEARA